MKVIAVVTARGGSKGLPGKNLRLLGGKPLIAWSIECALAVRDRLHRVVVTTDDPAIAEVSKLYGAEAPFLRPTELATDKAQSVDAIRHAIAYFEAEEGEPVDWVLLLQPTSPLRAPMDLEAALNLAATEPCDAIIGVSQVINSHPMLLKTIEDDTLKPYGKASLDGARRQDCHPDVYICNGALYLSRRDVVMEQGSLLGANARPYVMPAERALDIDSELDLRIAEALLPR